MEKILWRIVFLLIVIPTVCSSCSREFSGPDSDKSVETHDSGSSAKIYVSEGYELIDGNRLPIQLQLSSEGKNLKLLVSNESHESLFATRNLLINSMPGVPLVYVVVKNSGGKPLYVCGHFEDVQRSQDRVEIKAGASVNFLIDMADIKYRYCVSHGVVSVHVVRPMGKNFLTFASSNEVRI